MTTRIQSGVRSDRGSIHHLASIIPGMTQVLVWREGLQSWLRSLGSASCGPYPFDLTCAFLLSRRPRVLMVSVRSIDPTHPRSRSLPYRI